MHDYCVFDFYHVTQFSGGELHKVHDYRVFDCLSLILSPFQVKVSYIKCMIIDERVFDIFLFNLVTIAEGELHKVHDFRVFDCFLFNILTISGCELHKVHDYCVFDYFSFIMLPFQKVS